MPHHPDLRLSTTSPSGATNNAESDEDIPPLLTRHANDSSSSDSSSDSTESDHDPPPPLAHREDESSCSDSSQCGMGNPDGPPPLLRNLETHPSSSSDDSSPDSYEYDESPRPSHCPAPITAPLRWVAMTEEPPTNDAEDAGIPATICVPGYSS